MKHIRTAIAGILTLLTASCGMEPIFAQTFPTVPDHSVIGRIGTTGTSGPSQAIPFTTLGNQLGVVNTGWFVVGSAQYPTIQSAVNAASAQNGGVVYVPCGADIALGAGATGIDVSGTKNVRIVGASGQNSGATTCRAIRYTGTGTLIKADGSIGFEMSNLFVVGTSAAKCLSFDGRSTLAVYTSVKNNTIYCNTTAGIAVSISYAIIGTFSENTIIGYVGIRGDDETVGAISNVINFNRNTFLPGNTYHVQNPQGIWNFNNNTFEGGVSGTSIYTTAGSLSTCYVLNLIANDFDDAVAVGPAHGLIETKCKQVNAKGNVYSASSGQTVIVSPNGTGSRINSDGEFFNIDGTAVAIGTGNCGQVTNYRAPLAAFIFTGTANGCSIPDFNYNYPVFGAGLQAGVTGTKTGIISVAGGTSGLINITPQAAAGSYNWNLPTTAGSSGSLLTSGGGGASPMTWTAAGTGCITWLTTPSSANLRGCLTDETGTGLAYFQGGDIGTPSAGVVTNLTGTASININGTVGATTPAAGAFTSVAASSAIGLTNNQNASTFYNVANNSSGTSASMFYQATNGTSTMQLGVRGTAQTAYGILAAGTGFMYTAADFNLVSDGGKFAFGRSGAAETARFTTAGGLGVGTTTAGLGEIAASATVKGTTGFVLTNLVSSSTAPVATTFCTSPSIPANNGTAAFTINVGTGCATSVGTITMPAATTGWVCNFQNVTSPATSTIGQTGGTTTTVTVTNYVRTTGVAGNWTNSDVIRAMCSAY